MNLGNQLLASLPEYTFKKIAPSLSRVWLRPNTDLLQVGQAPEYAYFPESGIVAVACGDSRRPCFVGFYGFEGFGNLATVFGTPVSLHREFVQLAGSGFRIPINDLRRAIDAYPDFRSILFSYIHVFTMQISFSALSGSNTRIEQRLARWLLMYQDRVRGNVLYLTHQSLSAILGVRRAGVTETIHRLEGYQLIRAQRGLIYILDRPGLVLISEGSYGRPEAEYRRLINLRKDTAEVTLAG